MKKLISLILVCVMIMNLFSGCGLGIKKKTSDESSTSGSASGSSNLESGAFGDHAIVGSGAFTFEASGPENSFYRYLGEYKQTADLSGLTDRGLPHKIPETGPVGKWALREGVEIPAPAINPLGSQELYRDVLYYGPENPGSSAYNSLTFTFIQDFAAVDMTVTGTRWALEFDTNGGDVLPFLRDYAKKLGAEILESPYDDVVVFTLKQSDAYYWCKARADDDEVEIDIVKRRVYHVNQEFKLTAGDFDKDGECSFLVEMPGKKFTTLNVGLSTGSLRIKQYDTVHMNADKTYFNFYSGELRAEEYTQYTLYDFPQDPGLRWVEMDYPKDITEITVCFRETEYDLPGYKPGGQGLLVVKNAPNGKVSVMPQKHVSITDGLTGTRHEYYRDGASSPGGYGVQIEDAVYFNLPAGYYTLNEHIYLGTDYNSKSQLIPVSAGEQTTVTLPGSWQAASNALNSSSDDRELTGSITIGETKDLTQTAELAISVSDPQERDVFPTKENTVITEGGKQVEIVDIRREVAPCSVALVIDSSGSMAEDMKPTIEAAQRFVESLPDSGFIKIVDFAGYVSALPGETKADALKALAGIKSAGSTMLYDATLEGIKQVEGKTRPAVVVFTDGVDSREAPGTGKGSANIKDAVVKRIQDTGVPVYTIGFGKRLNEGENITDVDGAPDIACLIEFAAVSGGEYYPAKNPDALDAVFRAISSKLGNNFVVTYNRPTENNISDTPVYSLVIDNSGSMSISPREDGETNFRMEKTKQMLADFIGKLPQGAITQLMTFQGGGPTRVDINYSQMSTTNKLNTLKAIGEMQADRGTPIVTALQSAYENIIGVPTSKRVIVFLTDCGLLDSDYGFGDEVYYKILDTIKDKGIYVLWVGMGVDTPEWQARFAEAAERTNGEYVVSESTADIMKAMEALMGKVAQPGEDRITPITVDLSYKAENGELVTYKAQGAADFAPPAKKGTPVEPDYIKMETGKKLNVAGTAPGAGGLMATTAQKSAGLPGTDSLLHGSGPVGKTMRNNAMEMTVKEISYYNKLMGLDADWNDYRFAALEVEFKNTTEQKIEYQIPSIFQHFYMGVDGGLYPASKATWLMEKPITRHGDPSVKIPAGGTVAGTLVFLIPRDTKGYNQVSLHFYDTKYGHIQMPIVGGALDKWQELEKLPSPAPGKISDAFTMNVMASEMKTGIDQYEPGANAAFRVVEAEFKTNVQALLDINPAERIYLCYPTESGDLLAAMSGVTKYMPFGFQEEVMLGPASNNMVRLAYDVPKLMENNKSELYFDLATGSAVFPVSQGEAYGAPTPAAEFDTEFVKVRVNQLVRLKDDLNYPLSGGGTSRISKGRVLLDVTFIDKPSGDGMDGTRIPRDFFTLVNKNYQPPESSGSGAVTGVTAGRIGIGGGGESESKEITNPSRDNEGLIFGIGDNFGIFGNMSRRAVVIFDDPESDASDWTLQSKYYESVYAPVTEGDFASPELIAYTAEIPEKDDFQKQLDGAVNAAVKKYASLYSGNYSTVIRLDAGDEGTGKQSVDIPSINTYGIRCMEAVRTEEDFIGIMRGINAIPKSAGYSITDAVYAPESVVTQGFGDIGSSANAAAVLLTKLGLTPELKRLALTNQGKKALEGYYQFDVDASPMGIAYQNEKGERKTFVVPFMADLSELKGFVYIPTNSVLDSSDHTQNTHATVRVYSQYMAKATDDAAIGGGGLWGGLSDSLGGDEGGEHPKEKLMLEKEIPYATLSTDAIDIGFASTPSGMGQRYTAFLSTSEGLTGGAESIPATSRVLGIRIEVRGINYDAVTNYNTVPEGQSLDHFLITLAINLPDLPEQAAGDVEARMSEIRSAVDNPDSFSAAKWYGRSIIYRFIYGQTLFDRNASDQLDLTLGRLERPRCIAVSSHVTKDGSLYSSIDLMQAFNEVHAGEEDVKNAYMFTSGIFMSSIEAEVLPGDNKVGYKELWEQAPKDTVVNVIPCVQGGRDNLHDAMLGESKYPAPLLVAVKENAKILFVPSNPTEFGGEKRWSWLEIDPRTYETISVFDNGQHSAMVELKIDLMPSEDDLINWMKGMWVGTNVSVWTMCSSSLKFSNYKQIVADGKAQAKAVCDIIVQFFDIKEGAEKALESIVGTGVSVGDTIKIDIQIGPGKLSGSIGQDVYTLAGGLKTAVFIYFDILWAPRKNPPGTPPGTLPLNQYDE